MADISQKNKASSSAAVDLGLGDALKNQVEADILLRKKKQTGTQGMSMMSPAATMLLGGMGGV